MYGKVLRLHDDGKVPADNPFVGRPNTRPEIGSSRRGEVPGTGGLERVVFNEQLGELRRETLLTPLHQRIRDVRQGPDGLLYVITDEDDGALLRLEPLP